MTESKFAAEKISAVFGSHDPKALQQLRAVAEHAEHVAIMADGHVGYIMPVGGVAAYRNKVSVVGVGFDIACGNAAIRTDLTLGDDWTRKAKDVADEIARTVSFGIGRRNEAGDAPVNHPLFSAPAWDALREVAGKHESDSLKRKARNQLGTVGSGNHYVDVFADETDAIWVGVHFGSRGFGHSVASGFLALGQGEKWGTRVKEKETLLTLTEEQGAAYWDLMSLAGEYAYAGREYVARKVVEILGGREQEIVHNHHNFAWKEQHFGEELVVVRKGATPAFPGQKGFVGGSMGDQSVILRGATRSDAQPGALYSTVHGAGRVMSRTQARGKVKGWGAKAKVVSPGLVSQEMLDEWIKREGVILRGGGLDEAPHAYRRLPDVLAAQGDTIDVLHTLKPLIVVMAGADEHDPYKD